MSITPFSTITLKASPDGVTEAFVDVDSIQAESMRAYNCSTVEATLSIGSIINFPIPPMDSVVLHKGEGSSQVTAKTESGSAIIKCTAIKETGAGGGDIMGTLNMVTVLQDALGTQELIDKAAKKIADANKINAANKKESEDAIKVITDAKAAKQALQNEKAQYEAKVTAYNATVVTKNAELSEQQKDIAKQKNALLEMHANHLEEIISLQEEVETRYKAADAKLSELDIRTKNAEEQEKKNSFDAATNETSKNALDKEWAEVIKEKSKLAARKKRLDDANKEE